MHPFQNQKATILLRTAKVDLLSWNRVVIFLLFIAQATFCQAKHITRDEALNIAQKFYQERLSRIPPTAIKRTQLRTVSSADFTLNYVRTHVKQTATTSVIPAPSTDSTAYYYVYNVGNNQGFVSNYSPPPSTTNSILNYVI